MASVVAPGAAERPVGAASGASTRIGRPTRLAGPMPTRLMDLYVDELEDETETASNRDQ